jgi:Na+-transporting methylmalonyl-CoA/oxaloacetate decarboxylase gamma subunit
LDDQFVQSGGVQLQAIDAITALNGWAMAATGATIVILGLAILAAIISQLHKIIGFFEKKENAEPKVVESNPATPPSVEPLTTDHLSDLAATARYYRSLAPQLGDVFVLAQLYQALETADVPHPHITVRELKASGFLSPAGEGQFSWQNVQIPQQR